MTYQVIAKSNGVKTVEQIDSVRGLSNRLTNLKAEGFKIVKIKNITKQVVR